MAWSLRNGSLDIVTLQKLYHAGTLRPTDLVEAVYEQVAQCPVPHIWIYLLPREAVLAQAKRAGSSVEVRQGRTAALWGSLCHQGQY